MQHNFKKKYGQNFLSDSLLLADIVADAGITSDDCVLEIGPGAGALTVQLARVAKKVVAYEIDTELKPVLEKNLKGFDNVKVVFGDFMKANEQDIIDELGEDYAVVANLPYYITAPVVTEFAEKVQKGSRVKSLTLTLQKEVAERLVAKPATSDYGAITVMLNSVANTTLTRVINRDKFFPVPNVDSAVVSAKFCGNHLGINDFDDFRKITKCAFAQRRKTLSNNVMSFFGVNRQTADEWLNKNGIDGSVRGETLSVQQFKTLSNDLKNLKK